MQFNKSRKIELLSPAGNLEKLKFALEYGADAVYFGGKTGSLRAAAGNLSLSEIYEGAEFAHDMKRRVYLALNIYAHDSDFAEIETFLGEVRLAGIDGFIVSDPGVLTLIRELIPDAHIHLSTQASLTNSRAVGFWKSFGVNRVVLAREMSIDEIKKLNADMPEGLEIEAFAHGAMCVAYSGRCLLSAVMTGRNANSGECAHPCRYKYSLVEEKRQGEYFPIEEDRYGSYVLSSKDLCMIEHIPEMAAAGIKSIKIEGRMKSAYYVAVVTRAYRAALDMWHKDPEKYAFRDEWLSELKKVSHREFTTGFYFGKVMSAGQEAASTQVTSGGYITSYDFVGVVRGYDSGNALALVEQRNKIFKGDVVEVFGPGSDVFSVRIEEMRDHRGDEIDSAPHAQQLIYIKMGVPVKENFILRRHKS
ncbi:MAG: U32 family peptidase [Clostridiales Family XIII bacterium]|jgi:putative protease|nr:U32 family peptidase [Clostridiales Family XIII bacterium]